MAIAPAKDGSTPVGFGPQKEHYYIVRGASSDCRDFAAPSFEQIQTLSLSRLLSISKHGSINSATPCLFPQCESTFFFPDARAERIKSEYERMLYMFEKFPERGVPTVLIQDLEELLSMDPVLDRWDQLSCRLKDAVEKIRETIVQDMRPTQHRAGQDLHLLSKLDIVADPRHYPSNGQLSSLLWTKATTGAASSLQTAKGNDRMVNLIAIHAFLKDPTSICTADHRSTVTACAKIATDLLQQVRSAYRINGLSMPELTAAFVAQLSLEAMFLRRVQAANITHMRTDYQQQLVYMSATIDRLCRSEFSKPERVMELMVEMVDNSRGDIAPITVAHIAPYSKKDDVLLVIIDGNNRSTALTLLRYFASHTGSNRTTATLLDFCNQLKLGTKWKIDLLAAFTFITIHPTFADLNQSRIAKFINISTVPALLVDEADFFTMCMRTGTRESPVLLQPFHQTIYNDERAGLFAFRAKAGQAHGKAKSWPLFRLDL